MRTYFVYILTNHVNSVLYIGITNDLERRLYEHRHLQDINSFTKRYRLYKLVWFQEFNSPKEAIEIEKRIKGWRRSKKIDLIMNANPIFASLDPSTSSG